ncbi:hypothetical protein [Fodinicola feengrottensis]
MSTDLYCPDVDRYCIAVDSGQTVREVLDAFETDSDSSAAFTEVLECFPQSESALYLVPLLHRIHVDDFEPRGDDLPSVGRYAERGSRLYELEKLGIITDVRTEWTETSSGAYLSDGRALTTLHVPKTVIPVEVRYRFPDRWDSYSHSYASHWEVTDQLDPVPAGWYLIGETGDYTAKTVGVAYLGDSFGMSDDFMCHVAEVEGFTASRCEAQCDACETRWFAESGSWRFQPEYGFDADPWNFDDAAGFETDNRVSCPQCGTGRVGFMVI